LQPTGPANLVELEIPFVARIPLVAAPNLRRRPGVPDERVHRARGDAVAAIRRALCLSERPGRDLMPLGIEPLRAEGDLRVRAERAPRLRQMRVREEVPKASVRHMLLDAASHTAARCTRLLPCSRCAIRALREPAAGRG